MRRHTSLEYTFNLLLIIFDQLLLRPGLPERFCHFMAFVGGHLGLSCRHLQIMINKLLPEAFFRLLQQLSLFIQLLHLDVEPCLDLFFRLFGLRALFDAPSRCLYCPERVWLPHIL